jgi:PBSX family phage terminase large subunit
MINETELDAALTDLKTDMVKFKYVFNRSEALSIIESANKAGRDRSWYYKLPKDEQSRLEELAQELSAYSTKKVKIILDDNKVKAANRIVKLVDSRNEKIALDAAKEVLDRPAGRSETTTGSEPPGITLSVDMIAPSFIDAYDDINANNHTEYVFYGGRGSTKSSFVSIVIIERLLKNPTAHALLMRQVANTLRDSVYRQMIWSISEWGLEDKFKCTTSPLEITYIPTGQKIFFRGADDPGKVKSIKPPFGYIGILWFEELDQFHGEEAIRKIEQSVMRGGDSIIEFKTFNPPRTANNWVNKYVQIPKETQYQHRSSFLDLGARAARWLGKVFLEEAEHLKAVNPGAYEHEYLGVANGNGGMVFENVKVQKIPDDQYKQFDRILQGIDFGYYPDPWAYVKCHYDAGRHTLYILDELRMQKAGNRDTYNALIEKGVQPDELIIADSAEPKSIADYLEYGLTVRGAEKGPESVKYSIKWLQSLTAIVIDPERCPYALEEFLGYELEQDKNGDFISAYPDKNNHFIDAVRYATNLIWRRRGK